MRGKLTASLGLFAVLSTACARGEIVVRSAGRDEAAFVTQIAEFDGDVGAGLSLAVDGEGNPHLAYFAFDDPPAEGETPPPAEPGAPVLPAVKHAHLVGGAWTRSVVAEDLGDLAETDGTAIAVDAEGVHHIAWTAGGAILYANNAEGAFSEPETVAPAADGGISIAVSSGGTRWIAFYGANGLEVATSSATGAWSVGGVADARPGDPATTAVGLVGEDPSIVYGSEGRTLRATRSGDAWQPESVDPDGGLGVSLALDGDGNPHIAYLNAAGDVKHSHSIGGGPWETSDVGAGGVTDSPTTIAVDPGGVHHIAWQTDDGIAYATNAEGSFAEEDVAATEGGALPRLGAGAERVVHLAWYDPGEGEVLLATRGGEEPLLAIPAVSPTGPGPPTQPPPAECQPSGTEITLTAPPGAVTQGFAEDCLAAPAGEAFTVALANQDSAPHNFAIYTAQGGENLYSPDPPIVNAGENATYEVGAIEQTGQLFFQCDLHPQTMTGAFVVG